MNNISQGMTGYRMPAYMEEILTRNYCPCFVRMSIIREGESYRFSYRPGNMSRIRTDEMGTEDKLTLLRTIVNITDRTSAYLIRANNYLIEPELIYTQGGMLSDESVKILFYPDVKRMSAARKVILFSERIRGSGGRTDEEIFNQIRDAGESGDMNKIKLLLDKNLLRIGSRNALRAG